MRCLFDYESLTSVWGAERRCIVGVIEHRLDYWSLSVVSRVSESMKVGQGY